MRRSVTLCLALLLVGCRVQPTVIAPVELFPVDTPTPYTLPITVFDHDFSVSKLSIRKYVLNSPAYLLTRHPNAAILTLP